VPPKRREAKPIETFLTLALLQISQIMPVTMPPTAKQAKVVEVNQFLEKPLVAETELTPQPVKGNHKFANGNCTKYVADKRGGLPWSGNANRWLYNAPRFNYEVGDEPEVGAILVTNEGWVGHVAYVENIDSDRITISEMNYKGFGVVSQRTISKNYSAIKGYIY